MSQYGIITFVCTVTSRRVGCGCKVRSFTTLSEFGLSLSLRLRPMKTHSSNQEVKSNSSVLGKAKKKGGGGGGRKSPKVGSLELGCKRPGEISRISVWV